MFSPEEHFKENKIISQGKRQFSLRIARLRLRLRLRKIPEIFPGYRCLSHRQLLLLRQILHISVNFCLTLKRIFS